MCVCVFGTARCSVSNSSFCGSGMFVCDLAFQVAEAIICSILKMSFDVLLCRYKKEYKTVEELKHRFVTFLESVKLVETHNKGQHSYSLAVNGTRFLFQFFMFEVCLITVPKVLISPL